MKHQDKGNKDGDKGTQLFIKPLNMGRSHICVVGKQPLIMNRMAEKARQELLLPSGRKNSADKRSKLKHLPIEEYRSSIYRSSKPSALTAIHMPSGSFSCAMAHAALDVPGATKSQIQRIVRVEDLSVSIYGIPKLYMTPVRTAGINKTPDIRTRAIFPDWLAVFDISFVADLISKNTIGTLLNAAGFLVGVGDHRPEKGGVFGQFRLSDGNNDEKMLKLIEEGGTDAQLFAMQEPMPYDDDTAELLSWFQDEVQKR